MLGNGRWMIPDTFGRPDLYGNLDLGQLWTSKCHFQSKLIRTRRCSNALCFVFDLCGIVGGSVGFRGRSCIDLNSWDSLRDAKTPPGSHIQLVSHFRMRVRAILSLSLLVFFALTSTVGTCIHAGPACGISRWPGRHIWPALSRWKCIVSCIVAQTVAT